MNDIARSPLKSVLVTGGLGFIGSNFIRYMFEKTPFEGKIVNLDKLTYAANPQNLEDIAAAFPERYLLVRGDICDRKTVRGIFETHDIDTVVHFAAESHVDRSILGPAEFVQTNIVGTFTLLETARTYWLDGGAASRPHRFHHVSTDEVYGTLGPGDPPFTEDHPYLPNSPYAASKAASDHLVRAYHRTYGLQTTLSNCSNNYGPYQFPEKLIPLMILNALEGKPLPIYGDGLNIRDWLYVEDHCYGIWLVLTQGKPGETYNIGGNNERTNLEVVNRLCDRLEEVQPARDNRHVRDRGIARYRDLITFVRDRPGHDRRYAIDAEKAKKELGYQPRESFDTGLTKTLRWYVDHADWCRKVRDGSYRKWIAKQYGPMGDGDL